MPPFSFNQDMFNGCIQSLNYTTSSSATRNFEWSPIANVKNTSENCWRLFLLHQAHYNRRSSPDNGHKDRYAIFVENAIFVHRHNSREGSGHQVTLNQFSDRFPHELPITDLSFSVPEESSQKDEEKGEDAWTRIDFLPQARIFEKDWFENITIPQRKQLRRPKKLSLSHTDIQIELFRQHYPDFQNSPDDWKTYLNWASSDNPDGISLSHPVSDQVSVCFDITLHYDFITISKMK